MYLYPKPNPSGYTIYYKSGCIFCKNSKEILKSETGTKMINCDEFLIENKDKFLLFMKCIIGYEYRYMPMIFKDNQFIGGYTDLMNYLSID